MDGVGEATNAPTHATRGVRYESSSDQPVNEWSAAVYGELKDWASQQGGCWDFWEPDYLVLTIDEFEGAKIEPVVIDTCEGELTITFGYWESHLPGDGIYDDTDSHRAANGAKALTIQWLQGLLATAIYFDSADKWCGSKAVDEPIDLGVLVEVAWIDSFAPARVEVRKARKSEWQYFQISNSELSSLPDPRPSERIP